MRRPSVSFVIPMYNEELNIDHAINAAVEALTKYADDYEIVIVDDASVDASPRIVAERAAENPRIRMLRHEKNRKLGGALRTGFAAATKDVVLYMDADLPFDPDVLGRALRAMHVTGADVIAGYRHDRTMERSEEHTSELQSRFDLVCRLLLEKKKRRDCLLDLWIGAAAA